MLVERSERPMKVFLISARSLTLVQAYRNTSKHFYCSKKWFHGSTISLPKCCSSQYLVLPQLDEPRRNKLKYYIPEFELLETYTFSDSHVCLNVPGDH